MHYAWGMGQAPLTGALEHIPNRKNGQNIIKNLENENHPDHQSP